MKPYFLGVVGYSGSGKTTLLEKLIRRFHREGFSVGALKHDAHSFEIDYPGKDSYRLKHAGAKRILLSSKEKFALVEDRDKEKPFEDVKKMFLDCDIVFIEGYKLEDIDKIEVHRKETRHNYLFESQIKNIILLATDEMDKDTELHKCFIDDIECITEFIKERMQAG